MSNTQLILNTITDSGVIPLDDLSIMLKPLESKVLNLLVTGPLSSGYILNASIQALSLIPNTKVSISFSDTNTSDWKMTDSTVTLSEDAVRLYIYVQNLYHTELISQIKINLELFKRDTVSELSYHGAVVNGFLDHDIDPGKDRLLVIDPVPEGATYSYLKYSNGESLILLDDFSAIPYTPWEEV